MTKTKVSITKEISVRQSVRRAVELLGGMQVYIKPGQSVLLKPNATGPASPDKGITTNPEVLEAVLELVIEAGAGRIVIGDGTGSATLGTRKVFSTCGYDYLEKKYPNKFEFMDLNRQPQKMIKVKEPYILEEIQVIGCVYEFDVVINLPVLKTHFITGVSLGLKNLKGCIPPAQKRNMHEVGVNKAVADMNTILFADLTIVDGTIGSEGLGPKEGHPVGLGVILAGTDGVAVDAVSCAVMGFCAKDIEHIRLVNEKGVGTIDIDQIEILGEKIESVKRTFAPAIPKIPEGKSASILNGNACSGCISCAVISQSRLVDSGLLDSLAAENKQITFVIGGKFSADQEWPDPSNTFIIGNCAQGLKKRGQYIPGCAPACLDINRFISKYYGLDETLLETIVGDVDK